MCGLVACISKKSIGFGYKDKTIFTQMLYTDALRGEDSTGVFGVNKYGNLKMIKAATDSAKFIGTKTYENFANDMFSKLHIVVGHNRSATRGATTDENAHPFIEKNVCLVHNGTLFSHKHLADKEVDSHAICAAIAEKGMTKTLPEVNGAFALIWYDADLKKLFITRNKERPLWIIQTEDADYIASEPGMLSWIYERNLGKTIAPKYFDVDKVYSYDLNNLKAGFDMSDFPKKVYVPMIQQPATQVQTQAGGKTGWDFVFKNYKVGSNVVFTHDSNSVVQNNVTFRGKTLDEHNVTVLGTLNVSKLSAAELEDLLDGNDYLQGTVQGTSTHNGITKLIVSNIGVTDMYETVNGFILTEQDLASVGYTCQECGTVIDPTEEDGKFWARVKNGNVKSIKCAFCTKHHPHIQKEQECTSESSSSPTSRDQALVSAYGNFLDRDYHNLY